MCIFPIGTTDACAIAARCLALHGIPITDHPSPEVTHLLLDAPSFQADGRLRGGGCLGPTLDMLPPEVCVIGGNLDFPVLKDHRKLDLLQDAYYLAENAAITADCALRLAGGKMKKTFADSPALVIGWGRIGKCLAQMLHRLGCPVTVAARKESDLALLSALGYTGIPIGTIGKTINSFSLIFNTVPASVLLQTVPDGCIALELASKPGMPEENVIRAGGLPGLWASESSGRLIAKTILRHMKEDT